MNEVLLSTLTTMGVGGPAGRLVEARSRDELVAAALAADAESDQFEPWLLLAGGSNLVVSDAGVPGTVVKVASRGIEVLPDDPAPVRPAGEERAADRHVVVRVQAGEPWDGVVAWTVEQGLAGIEALSGIPGLAGAAPIQNIGAYGQEVGSVLQSIEFLDLDTGDVRTIPASKLALGYRMSAIKAGQLRGVVLSLDLRLTRSEDGRGTPIAYAQLAKALGLDLGDRAPLAEVRAAVLATRSAKGMVYGDDPDSHSAGSFFMNPIVSEAFARGLPEDAPRFSVTPEPTSTVLPLDTDTYVPYRDIDYRVKLSAAWLMEHAGIAPGFRLPGSKAAISSKHTLAITNTGGATAAEVLQLAGYVQTRVENEFGVRLVPEPVIVEDPIA